MKYPRLPTKCTTYIPSGVGADSSCPYFSIAKSVFSHHQIHIFVSSQTRFHSSFCGYIRIYGRDKSAPTAANGLPTTLLTNWNNVANILWDIHIHPRKHPTYIPSGVGADSSCPYPYIVKSVFSHHQIHIFVSSQTHFCSPFCGYIRIWGHDKYTPTAANGLPTTLLTDWNNVANILWNIHVCPRNALRTICNNITFKKQKPYFCIADYTLLYIYHTSNQRVDPLNCITIHCNSINFAPISLNRNIASAHHFRWCLQNKIATQGHFKH